LRHEYKGKDYKQARSFYQQLIDDFHKSTYLPQAYYSLGWSFFEEGSFGQSIDAFQKLIETTEEQRKTSGAETREQKLLRLISGLDKNNDLEEIVSKTVSKTPEDQLR